MMRNASQLQYFMSLNRQVYTVELGMTQKIELTPQSPLDFRLPIPAAFDYVVLSLESPDDLCMTVSSFDGNCTSGGGGIPVQTISADRKERALPPCSIATNIDVFRLSMPCN